MSGRCSDACLIHWHAVSAAARGAWERKFAGEIAEKAQKPWWRPTARQLEVMNRMVDALFYERGNNPLIERE